MVDPVFTRGPGLTPATLKIVRYAMLVMLLMFGAFGYYQSTHRVPDPESMTNLPMLQSVRSGTTSRPIACRTRSP
jgi:hypothetical protein